MPTRADLPVLGTATRQLIEIDTTAKMNEEHFRKEAEELRKQREARG
jgi:hypothetical protein